MRDGKTVTLSYGWQVCLNVLNAWSNGRGVVCVQAFDAMIHFSFEGSFLYLSTFGRQVNTSVGPFAEMCMSCSVADRWFYADFFLLHLQGENTLRLISVGDSRILLSYLWRY